MKHLFFHSEVATECWHRLLVNWLSVLHFASPISPWELFWWAFDSPTSSRGKPLICFTIAYMLWEIWKGWISSRFGGNTMNAIEIMRHVTQWLRSTHSLVPIVVKCSTSMCEALRVWGIHITPTTILTSVRFFMWTPPQPRHLKLNVDGASRGNPSHVGGGGILRDHRGRIIFAFSHFYDVQTNIAAEAMSIWDGLLLCAARDLRDIFLESDSRVLVDMLCSGHCAHWRLKSVWIDIMRCQTRLRTINHQFREGNQTADALASHAIHSRQRSLFTICQDMPQEARGCHCLKKLGMPSLGISRALFLTSSPQWRFAWGSLP